MWGWAAGWRLRPTCAGEGHLTGEVPSAGCQGFCTESAWPAGVEILCSLPPGQVGPEGKGGPHRVRADQDRGVKARGRCPCSPHPGVGISCLEVLWGGDRTSLSAFQSLEVPGLGVATLSGAGKCSEEPRAQGGPERAWAVQARLRPGNPWWVSGEAGKDPAPTPQWDVKGTPPPLLCPAPPVSGACVPSANEAAGLMGGGSCSIPHLGQ